MTATDETDYFIEASKHAFLDVSDEAVLLERARILAAAVEKYRDLPLGLRQARAIEDLCKGVTPLVNSSDVFLGKVLEEIPSSGEEEWIDAHPELFIQPGVPGFLDSSSVYSPDWDKLLRLGIGGLVDEVDGRLAESDDDPGGYLAGVRLSLLAVSELARRFADEARRTARRLDGQETPHLQAAADRMEKVSMSAPETFAEALQLFLLFHMVLSCLIGARNVTPGRMDQYLLPFYEKDLASGVISRREAVGLLAVAMVQMSQASGEIQTDFQSTKRTPNKHSHFYITLAGVKSDGSCAANALSHAILDAVRLGGLREPSLSVRYHANISGDFWRAVLAMMRDGLPVLAYNDKVVTGALAAEGMSRETASTYIHAGCMNCILPGRGVPCMRDNHNMAASILLTASGGRNLLTGRLENPDAPAPESLGDFDAFLDALRQQVRRELALRLASYEGMEHRLPLPVWPLFEGHLDAGREYWERQPRYVDQHLVGVATAVDSLLAVRQIVYEERILDLEQFAGVLAADFEGHESLRRHVLRGVPHYGCDDVQVLEMIDVLGNIWVEEVERCGADRSGIALRPGFHSWLFNLELGAKTAATPDGRLRGEPLSSDFLPSAPRGRAPTEILRCMARLPNRHTCSGGSTLVLDKTHFAGDEGVERLRALVEGYFDEGGLQLHFIFNDRKTLLDAIKHPEKHADLLVRVTGYSEYFVRLLPEVQRDIIRRTESA